MVLKSVVRLILCICATLAASSYDHTDRRPVNHSRSHHIHLTRKYYNHSANGLWRENNSRNSTDTIEYNETIGSGNHSRSQHAHATRKYRNYNANGWRGNSSRFSNGTIESIYHGFWWRGNNSHTINGTIESTHDRLSRRRGNHYDRGNGTGTLKYDRFSRWRDSGVHQSMIQCCGFSIINAKESYQTPHNMKRICYIRVKNNIVTVKPFDPTLKFLPTETEPDRLQASKLGVEAAIEYARKYLKIDPFPDLYVLFSPYDDARIVRPTSSRSKCDNNYFAWPPVFAQNREYLDGNLFVTVPDFSFFTDFKHRGHHGNEGDIWFDVVRKELDYHVRNKSTYRPSEFEQKPSHKAIWRGKASKRDWSDTREAISKCQQKDLIDSMGQNVWKPDMCSQYKVIVTIPGNGVWSWATKFNLLCNSVTVLIRAEEINGESWETREELNLRHYEHYIGISSIKRLLCEQLAEKVEWVQQYPEAAKQIAMNGRKLVLERLNKDAILRDFALLLLDYASLQKPDPVEMFL